MKIITASKFYYMRAGLESYLFKLSELLSGNGHKVIPFSTKHPSTIKTPYSKYFANYYELSGSEKMSTFSKIKALFNIYYNFEAANKIGQLLDDEKPDLLWGFGVHRHLSPSIFVEAKKRNIPVIHRLSDYALICPNAILFSEGQPCSELLCPLKGYDNAIKKQCVICKNSKGSSLTSLIGASEVFLHNKFGLYKDNVDKFVAPSKFLRAVMIKSGFNQEKIVHLPIFIDSTKFKPEPNSQDYYVYFGRLSEEKGLGLLLEAARINRKHKLIIIGDGPSKEKLFEFKEKNKLNNVIFAGKLHGDSLYDIVRNARFVVVPSVWYDNSPNVILEAYALAKPVLAAKIGGIPEYVDDNQTGCVYKHDSLCQLAEKINQLMNNKLFCTSMGLNAHFKVVNEFSPQKHFERVEKIINAV